MTIRKVLLLDMDGTITPSRQKLLPAHLLEFQLAFARAHTAGYDVGVVTGSGLDFMLQQISELWGKGYVDWWMPCNGTILHKDGIEEPIHQDRMDIELSGKGYHNRVPGSGYRDLISYLLQEQAWCSTTCPMIITGSFLTFRGSLLNWCPIGRDGDNQLRREIFIQFDSETRFRHTLRKRLLTWAKLSKLDLDASVGGETSLDIYPTGWDKRYALNHFPDAEAMFIGDAVFPGGNDFEIAEATDGYATTGPEDTLRILRELFPCSK